MLNVLRALLALLGVGFFAQWFRQIRADHAFKWPTPLQTIIGLVTNFFDTLGIGSYAPTTAAYKGFKLVEDEQIPGTMNVGNVINTLIQFPIFLVITDVDQGILLGWIGFATLGAWLGAGFVSRMPRRKIQLGMGIGLTIAAVLLVLRISPDLGGPQILPSGGDTEGALGVTGLPLVIACAAAFVLGSLMTIGIGIYAPTMVAVAMLGMAPSTAFPLMTGAAAFLMPVASIRFIQARRYNVQAALGLAFGGAVGVLLAAKVFAWLGDHLLGFRILTIVVISYTAVVMLRAAAKEKNQATAPQPKVPVHS
jgi:uncharacterized membrane protein YfcA